VADRRLRSASLNDWRGMLERYSRSPYVGPRPQTSEDRGMLIGRERVLATIARKVQDAAVLVLDGASGSGKTSLFQNGLRPQVEGIGFRVFVCRRWAAIPEDTDVDGYLMSALLRETRDQPELPAVLPPPGGGTQIAAFFSSRLCEALDDAFDGNAVLVLDQFEELLRQHPADARRVMAWVRDVVDNHDVRFILSLRSDAMHLLDPHLKGLRPFSLDRETITSFSDENSVALIIASRKDEDLLPNVAVETEVTQAILDAWRAHLDPRLLGLQALLWSLYFEARKRAGADPLEPDPGVTVTIDRATLDAVVSGATDMFRAGLLASVRFALSHAEAVCRQSSIDPYLLHGTKELVGRATPYLWSGGFKVPAVERELVRRILEPELRILWGDESEEQGRLAGELVARMLDDDLLGFTAEAIEEAGTAVSSRNDVSAGPLLGRGADVVMFEECRRAAFAIEWLRATGIAQRTEDHRLTLVHDGSGLALGAWAERNRGGFGHAVHRLTAARGERFDFTSDDSIKVVGWSYTGKSDGLRVMPNLNWRDCRITGTFEQTIFLNCDFGGARFVGARFDGVTFVNCLLDDANFESCLVEGFTAAEPPKRQQHDVAKVRIAPSFEVPVAPAMVAAFAPYVAEAAAAAGDAPSFFFSDAVGTPAVPGARSEGHVGELVEFRPAQRGLALVGGRISFLTIHSCGRSEDATEPGAIELHFVAGGGLDIVEPVGMSVVLHDCALRGISVTRDQTEHDGRCEAGTIDFCANDCFLVYVYFSGELSGRAAFANSTLWGVMNASGTDSELESSLRLTIEECRHQFVVNAASIVHSIEDSRAHTPPPYFEQRAGEVSVFVARGPSDLATQLEFMDYRRVPEVRERHQRAVWADGNPE
jgi:hypothetical protein